MKTVLINDNLYVEVVKYFLLVMGIWPRENIRYAWIRSIYRFYCYVPYALIVISASVQLIDIPILISRKEIDSVLTVLSLVVSYVVVLIKLYLFTSETITGVTEDITATCRTLRDCPDDDVRTIFMANADHAITINKYYCGFVALVLNLLAIGSWYQYSVVYPRELSDTTGKPLVFICWLPFDPDRYYGWTLGLQTWIIYMGGSYYASLQCKLLGPIIYVSGQLQVLQHCFRHFQKYVHNYGDSYGVDRRQAARYVMRTLIKKHQQIIRLHNDLNNGLTYILLTELLLNSILVATMLFSMTKQVIDFSTPFSLTYTALMVSHIFILYWHTNEIIVNSLALADAVMESKWNEEDLWVQTSIVLIVLRAQRPLAITCGPFATASTDSIITILKASYSYSMLMMR